MLYFEKGAVEEVLSLEDIKSGLQEALGKMESKSKVLIIPPDITRAHSFAGPITEMLWGEMGDAVKDILPALGTHNPMSEGEIREMYGSVPQSLFRVHDWRNDVVSLGDVPSEYIKEISGGKVSYSWPAQVNKMLVENDYDLILSVGQVVPHEVIGMANYNKNIFVGTGGAEGINKSHFLGAAYGMEKIMGRAENPVREVLNYASREFAKDLPIVYIQTVVGRAEDGKLVPRGMYIGDDEECFLKAADLSLKVNFEMLEEPLDKVVVWLDPAEFRSTWLGNKSIYRTRMAIADGGSLIVLAPGVKEFGEDKEIDKLIRKYGYKTTKEVLDYVSNNRDLRDNLSAAAHLIHGTSDNRFSITYCPGHLSRTEIESVNYKYGDLSMMMQKYNPEELREGMNTMSDGEKVFFISNPATGLWSVKDKFEK